MSYHRLIFFFFFTFHFLLQLVREQLKELTKQFDKSENDLKALQSVGQIVGEVLKQLTEDKCKFTILVKIDDFWFMRIWIFFLFS